MAWYWEDVSTLEKARLAAHVGAGYCLAVAALAGLFGIINAFTTAAVHTSVWMFVGAAMFALAGWRIWTKMSRTWAMIALLLYIAVVLLWVRTGILVLLLLSLKLISGVRGAFAYHRELAKLEVAGDAVIEAQQPVGALTLSQYLDLIAGIPLPTAQQRIGFAEFVSTAHSWYKHLPRALPGVPLYFFIDKYAACDRVIMEDRSRVLVERAERGFHYSDLPTQEYRSRFGYLAFSSGGGTTVFPISGGGPQLCPRGPAVAVPGDDGKMYDLPIEVVEAGRASLTAAIHPFSAGYPYWDALKDWPEESGGRAILEALAERCRTMQRFRSLSEGKIFVQQAGGRVDEVLYELLAPERRRQMKEVVNAVDRVCELITRRRQS